MTKDTIEIVAVNQGQTGIEDQKKYLLRAKREKIRLLKALREKLDLITARIPGSGHAVMTAVLDVLPKKNLVVLDYGPNEALNKKMLAAEKVIFTARHEMVDTRFSCSGLKRVKYQGQPAFAAAIPDSVLYLQRREYFRIKPLVAFPVTCKLSREDQVVLKLKVIDIGIRGLSLLDKEFQLQVSKGVMFEACTLLLPANPSLEVELEVCYMLTTNMKEGQQISRVGGKFINISPTDEYKLQRFINMVQIEQNAISKA